MAVEEWLYPNKEEEDIRRIYSLLSKIKFPNKNKVPDWVPEELREWR